MNRIAVIDLGTNTCNLGIGLADKNRVKVLHTQRLPVLLAEGGIGERIITPQAQDRAVGAISEYVKVAEQYDVDQVVAYATSAVRNALNRSVFIERVKDETGVDLQVISGNREAELIFKGVAEAIAPLDELVLILDIGGGSNEFILTDGERIVWKQSFEIGIARIYEMFKPEVPVAQEDIEKIEHYYDQFLEPLWELLSKYRVKTLVGCAGAFDAFADLILECEPESHFRDKTALNLLQMGDLHKRLINDTPDIKKLLEPAEPIRRKMIVYASIFVNFVLKRTSITNIVQTSYAMKEGVMVERLLNPNNKNNVQ